MKKLALALVCMFSVAFFASCTKTIEHPEPAISVMTGDYCITGTADNPTVIDADDDSYINYKYGFHVESNAQTKKELKNMILTLEVITDGEPDVYYDTIDLTGKTSYDFSDYLFEQDREIITVMEGTIKAVVTDVDNLSSTATVAFTIEMEEEPLIGHTVTWIRKGANVDPDTKTAMAALGLEWTGTYKAPFATIKPLDGAQLYVCDGADFDDIIYESDKNAYFTSLAAESTPVESYRNIDANASDDYDDMLAIIYGEDLNLVRINHAQIDNLGSQGTQITITGFAK